MRVWHFVCSLILAVTAGGTAEAGACAADSDNPMVSSEDYGVARCRAQGERYHVRDHAGEGARDYAEASDPMVWSDAQWRSTLFGGYARSYDDGYDRRFRREAGAPARRVIKIERRVEMTVADAASNAAPERKPRGPKHISTRTPSDLKAGPGVLRFSGHNCRGVLVLTWGTLGSKARCHSGGRRIHTP